MLGAIILAYLFIGVVHFVVCAEDHKFPVDRTISTAIIVMIFWLPIWGTILIEDLRKLLKP